LKNAEEIEKKINSKLKEIDNLFNESKPIDTSIRIE
jgi:hypothetical protein